MSNIQEDVTKQVWDLFLKFIGTGSEFVYQIAHEGNTTLKQGSNFTRDLLVALINKQKQTGEPIDDTAKMLKRVEKGESINTMSVADEDAVELSKYFQEKGILFKVIDNLNDDTKFFMYMSDDAQKVVNIITLWQAEKGLISEMNPELFLNNCVQEGVGTLSGLDNADLEIFRNFAKEKGLIFASTAAEAPDRYIVIYNPKDTATVKKVMDSALWAFSGTEGNFLREQMTLFLKNKKEVNRSLLEPEKEFYIVDGKSPDNYVYLTANDFTYYKNSKEILNVSRNSVDFIERGLRVFDSMFQPVVLTREEFELFNKEGELDKATIKKVVVEKAKDIPSTDDLKELQKKQNDRLERLQSKMILDDENTAGFWIYDDSIDLAEGGGYENFEDIEENIEKIDTKDREGILDARSRAKQYKFCQVENKSLDYLISVAEKHRNQPSQEPQPKELEL